MRELVWVPIASSASSTMTSRPESASARVITSYSIHYTKLYEKTARASGRGGRRNTICGLGVDRYSYNFV